MYAKAPVAIETPKSHLCALPAKQWGMGQPLPFVAVVRAGCALCVFVALSALSFPVEMGPLPEGMHTPVLALELARTTDEVETMFGKPGSHERNAWAQAIDRGNTIDFATLVAYGAMLLLYTRALRERTGHRHLRVVSVLSLLAPLADALENMRMFGITAQLFGDYRAELLALAWFTWIKWATLALSFALLAPSVFARAGSGRLLAVPLVLPIVVTPFGWHARGLWAEAMLALVGLSFVAMLVHAVVEQRRAPT
jgi:hypothetical protein